MAPTVSKTINQAATQITRDEESWSGDLGESAGPITYAFRSTGGGSEHSDSFTRFSAAQIAATEEILRLWSDVAEITFSRVGGAGYSNSATMLFSNYDQGDEDDGYAAYAYHPGSTSSSADAGDVWVDQSSSSNNDIGFGERGFTRLIHEIGHAIGLQHPGDYNAAPGVDITYDGNAEYIQDSKQYTVMSYFSAAETGADHVHSGGTTFGATPLLHDIAAVQRLYGANMSTRTGNDDLWLQFQREPRVVPHRQPQREGGVRGLGRGRHGYVRFLRLRQRPGHQPVRRSVFRCWGI